MIRARQPTSSRPDMSKIDVSFMVLFYEVVTSGSINQAATRLKISKASISRKLRTLEQQLGAVLLKRGAHKLSMTSSGEVLFQYSERILAEAQGARSALAEMQSELTGQIQVVAAFGLASWLTPALATFAQLYPR